MRTCIGISMVIKIARTNRTLVIVVTFEDRWLPSSRGSSGGSSKQPHWTSPSSSQAPCSTWNKGRMYNLFTKIVWRPAGCQTEGINTFELLPLFVPTTHHQQGVIEHSHSKAPPRNRHRGHLHVLELFSRCHDQEESSPRARLAPCLEVLE